MNVYAALALGSYLSFFFMGVFVIYLDKKKYLNQVFLLYAISAGIYCFAEFGYLQAESYDTTQFWLKVRSFWALTFAIALHFHMIFSEKKKWIYSWWRMAIVYLPGLIFFFADLFTHRVTGFPVFTGTIWTFDPPRDSILYQSSGWYAFIYVLIMSGMTIHYMLTTRDKMKRSQASYLLVAHLLGIMLVLLNTLLVKTVRFQQFHVDSILSLSTNLVVVYAIWKFNLMRFTPQLASREIISTMSNFLILVNPNYVIDTINTAAEELTGYSPGELEGKSIGLLMGQVAELDRPSELLSLYTHKLLVKNKTGYLFSRTGEKIPVSYSISAVPMRRQQGIGFIIVGSEYTDLKEVEEKLRGNTRKLQQTNESLQQFSRIVSHDFKESLRLINSFTQLVKKQSGTWDHRTDEYLDYVETEAQKLYNKLSGLIEHLKVEDHKNYQMVDMNEVLDDTLAELELFIHENQAKVAVEKLPEIFTDRIQMNTLFTNLISNAIKFRSRQPPVIHISATQTGKNTWTFSVRDNGIGIEPGYHYKIFTMFERLTNTMDKPGQGIGLSLCKKIVEQNQGRIWVESEPGQGSVFHFTLPIIRDIEVEPMILN